MKGGHPQLYCITLCMGTGIAHYHELNNGYNAPLSIAIPCACYSV